MSTRRARIKAVTALPPRRKNADSAADKKKQEDLKEGFESGVKLPSVRRPSTNDKTPKAKRVSTDTEHSKEELAIRVSPLKRRLSLDKTQGQHRFSIDKAGQSTKEGYENDVKALKSRRFSLDKTPKRCLSIDKTPAKHSSEAINTDQPLSVEKTIQHTPALVKNTNIPEKSGEATASKKLSIGNWIPNTKILQNLLNGSEKSPKTFPLRSPVPETTDLTGKGKVQFDCNPSTSKKDSSESNMPELIALDTKKIPFFASPQGRASPRRPPIVRTPVIAVDLIAEKLIAPHKGPNSMSEQNYIEIHAAEGTPKNSKPEDEVIIEKNNKTGTNELKSAPAPAKKSKCSIQIIDEYVIKPVPEASTVMDGIVPLQSATKASKPIDLLKNEIISENAEVLFDPIVPLPSPSKVRPKLRPVPRLGPRRNSFQQGSASESEDENRRILGRPLTPATPVPSRQRNDSHSLHAVPIVQRDVARVRNDSVCSNISQSASHAAVSSPLRERDKSLKTRREEMTARRNAAMRRRHVEVEREKLTMYDFIFYNPKDNPIIPDQDEIKAKEANKKEEEERKAEASQASSKAEATDSAPAAVPQIKLGPNGEIILDEQSLVVNQSDQRKLDSTVVREGAWGGSGSRAYRRTPRTADWSDAETVRFYRALAAMGTDFTLMQPLFPARSRRDLKLKFKKEERLNLSQVDMALRSGAEWDPDRLQTEFAEERKAAEEAAKKAAERLKREKEAEKERERDMKLLRMRRSKCSKSLGDSGMPQTFNHSKTAPATLDEYVKFQQERSKKPRRTRKQKQDQDLDVTMQSVTVTPVPPIRTPSPSLATLTLVDRNSKLRQIASKRQTPNDLATLTKEFSSPLVPTNIETGSLVVLTVNDPQSPSRKMLQTYIAQGPGNLTPVSLPANFLNSVVGFMKKSNSPKPTVMGSPSTSRSKTPNIISPRKRTSSYNITQL